MSYINMSDFSKAPVCVRVTLLDRTNFLACALERKCTTCGSRLSAYSSKAVNILTGEINCGHDEIYKKDGSLEEGWCSYSDG